MFKIRRVVAFVIAIVAGILLLLTGTQGPIAFYQTIINILPQLTQNQQILQITNIIAAIFIAIALAGGLAVILGGILILYNHVTFGKLLIGIGAGAGIVWLILLIITLLTADQAASIIEQRSIFSWIGLILAFIAGIVAK